MKRDQTNTAVAGIDVGKRKLDVAALGEEPPIVLTNDPQGHLQLIDWLAERSVSRVGMEASGGYEKPVMLTLAQAGFDVVVHQPLEVRLFARLKRIRAKSDPIDAQVIAMATAQVDAVRAAQDPALARLAERLTVYEHISEALAKAKTIRQQLAVPEALDVVDAEIASLKALKAAASRQLIDDLKASPHTRQRLELLQSLPGVGPLTAASLVIRMPELGTLERGQPASLLGVAPFDRDSATLKGKRFIQGGRSRPRRFVYLAALAARRCDPGLRAFAQRLTQAGKPPKVVLVALMRKLIEAANIVLARGTPWNATKPA